MANKNYMENRVIEECRKQLSPRNIQKIAKAAVKIAESFDDRSEIIRLKALIQEVQATKENHMVSLRACNDNAVREMIFEDLRKVCADTEAYEKQLEIEIVRREAITEDQVIKSLTRLAEGDINDIAYRRSLVRLLVSKIFLYDDRYTITFNSGDEEVTIPDMLLDAIEKELDGDSLCLLKQEGHHFFSPAQRSCISRVEA